MQCAFYNPTFFERKLRVAAYCRISTKMEKQQLSLGHQERYYRKLIEETPEWEFAGIYIDVASGTSRRKRYQFNAMIRDCLQHKIDLVLVKSVSRFGRNTLESLEVTRMLKQNGVEVYFETADVWLQKMDSEFPLAVMSAVAQVESENKSRAVTWGIRAGFRMGNSKRANRVCYGYQKGADGNLVIDEIQAEIVQKIFKWYLGGDSFRRIIKRLYETQVSSPSGKEQWTPCEISKLLSNEKYTGNVVLQKTYIIDYWNHTQAENKGQLPKYVYENNNPAIISKETFEQVQLVKSQRSNMDLREDGETKRKAVRYSSGQELSGRIKCSLCGRNFRRITTHAGEIVWRCAGRVEKQGQKCTAPTVKQTELISEVCRVAHVTELNLDTISEIVGCICVGENGIMVVLKEHLIGRTVTFLEQ